LKSPAENRPPSRYREEGPFSDIIPVVEDAEITAAALTLEDDEEWVSEGVEAARRHDTA
jgi:hypothetical protein